KKMITGRITTTEAAIITPQSNTSDPVKEYSATETGIFSELFINSKANKNSFQVFIKVNIAVATIPGATIGKTICKKVLNFPAPSTLDDSSISNGTDLKKPINIQIANGMEKDKYAIISPVHVLSKPTCVSIIVKGTANKIGGNTYVISKILVIGLPPFGKNRTIAYAANDDTIIVMNVAVMETIKLFNKFFPNPKSLNTVI